MATEQGAFNYYFAGGLAAPTDFALTAAGGYSVLTGGTLDTFSSGVTQALGVITLNEGSHLWTGTFDMSFSTAAVGLTQVTAALFIDGVVSAKYLTAVEQSIAGQAQAMSFSWQVPVVAESTTVEVRIKVSADDTVSVYHAQFAGVQLLGYIGSNADLG